MLLRGSSAGLNRCANTTVAWHNDAGHDADRQNIGHGCTAPIADSAAPNSTGGSGRLSTSRAKALSG